MSKGPPPLPPMTPQGFYQGGPYAQPPKKGNAWVIIAIVAAVGGLLFISCAIAVLVPALNKVRQEAQKAKCAANLRSLGTVLGMYANSNGGVYPDKLSRLTTIIATTNDFVCPATTDTPATGGSSIDSPGHLSYVYVGAGKMPTMMGAGDVLIYEPLSNHSNTGINVLFGDLHVEFLNAADAQNLIAGLSSRH